MKFQANTHRGEVEDLWPDHCDCETGNACTICFSVSEPFSPSADISVLSLSDCARFCDIRRFTQTGTCVFYVAAHSPCSYSLTFCLLGGIHITFIQYFCRLADAHIHRDAHVQQNEIKLRNLLTAAAKNTMFLNAFSCFTCIVLTILWGATGRKIF